MQKSRGIVGSGLGGMGVGYWGLWDVNQELKVLFYVHKGIVQY